MLLPELSLSRTVMREVDVPSAVSDVDAAMTVDVAVEGTPGLSVITGCVERAIAFAFNGFAVTVIVSVPGEVPEV